MKIDIFAHCSESKLPANDSDETSWATKASKLLIMGKHKNKSIKRDVCNKMQFCVDSQSQHFSVLFHVGPLASLSSWNRPCRTRKPSFIVDEQIANSPGFFPPNLFMQMMWCVAWDYINRCESTRRVEIMMHDNHNNGMHFAHKNWAIKRVTAFCGI